MITMHATEEETISSYIERASKFGLTITEYTKPRPLPPGVRGPCYIVGVPDDRFGGVDQSQHCVCFYHYQQIHWYLLGMEMAHRIIGDELSKALKSPWGFSVKFGKDK